MLFRNISKLREGSNAVVTMAQCKCFLPILGKEFQIAYPISYSNNASAFLSSSTQYLHPLIPGSPGKSTELPRYPFKELLQANFSLEEQNGVD